ncbi:MAG: Ppx/GppA phosphatase [Solirubrobacterales bacterium]|jgi:exopolyphosphatase/guanosine-5'-triphosphate,3'-diphosphate pyrophosphatase|nr:Ppx/GppA phosphatase [Solirubrobacterales bacterium]
MMAVLDAMTPTRSACIDIGSNTTRLLVADLEDGRMTEVGALRAFTALGAGRAPGDPLQADCIAAVVTAVGRQLALARRLGATTVDVVATSAVRSAPNGDAVVTAVSEAHGVTLRVLTGEQEAAYAFAGATATVDGVAPDAPVAVVDVGGGSTELVLGTLRDGPSWSVSVPIGSGRLPPCGDPPRPEDLRRLRVLVDEAFADVRSPSAVGLALAVGGSATSVVRLVGGLLSPDALDRALEVLCGGSVREVAAAHLMDERRVALLPAGLVLLRAASTTLDVPLHVAGGGLREGLLRLGSPDSGGRRPGPALG